MQLCKMTTRLLICNLISCVGLVTLFANFIHSGKFSSSQNWHLIELKWASHFNLIFSCILVIFWYNINRAILFSCVHSNPVLWQTVWYSWRQVTIVTNLFSVFFFFLSFPFALWLLSGLVFIAVWFVKAMACLAGCGAQHDSGLINIC